MIFYNLQEQQQKLPCLTDREYSEKIKIAAVGNTKK